MRTTPIDVLRKRVDAQSQAAVAAELGITQGYLSDILNGNRALGPKILKALGFKKVVVFEPIRKSDEAAA